jgi:Predicted permease
MYAGKDFNERLKQIGLTLLLLFLVIVIVKELRYFASAFLGGITLYILLRKPHQYLSNKWKNTTLATTFLMLVSFTTLLIIGTAIFYFFYEQIRHFHPQSIINGVYHIQDIIQSKFGYNILSEDVISKVVSFVGNLVPDIISATGNVFSNLLMMMFILFFMLQANKTLIKTLENLIPLSSGSISLLKHETNNMIVGNAIGIPLIMICQALVSGVAYWILDAGDPILWGFMTGLFGLVPIVGTGGIWAPLAINLLAGGHIWQGIVLLAYGALVISYVDNFLRMSLMKRMANVHPLVTLFGIILGMNLFGFWGIIFGPLIISTFLLLLKIYRKEFLIQ